MPNDKKLVNQGLNMLKALFGEFNWQPPEWAKKIGLSRQRVVATALVAAALTVAGYALLFDRPPGDNDILASISPPELAQWQNDKLQAQALTVSFNWAKPLTERASEGESFARLELLGKVLAEPPTLTPEKSGEWRFVNANTLKFTPTEPWPAQTTYRLRLPEKLFQTGLKLGQPTLHFTTRPFEASIENFRFHQNPGHKDDKALRATLRFSHPVDKESLNQQLQLSMRTDGEDTSQPPKKLSSTTRFAESGRLVYLLSEALQLPKVEARADLSLGKKLKSAEGEGVLDQPIAASTLVPDISSYFHVDSIASHIARDEDNKPMQALTLSFTDRVSTARLNQSMEVFLLPKFKRPGKTSNYPDYWQEPGEVTESVLARARQLSLTLDPIADKAASLHSAALDLPAGRFLFVKIQSGLRSESGYESAQDHRSIVRIPDYPKEVSIGREGAILALSGDHKLSFVSRGLTALKIDVGVMNPDNVANLASQTYGDIDRPSFPNYRFNKDNLTERHSRILALSQRHPAEAQFTHIDLSDQLPKSGFFFIEVQGWDPVNKHPTGASDSRFIAISDLGVLVKVANDGSQDIFVHSIASGNPVAGAKVELISKNASVAMSVITGSRGHAKLESAESLRREKEPVAYLVSYKGDRMFLPYRRAERMLRYSRYEVGGEYARGPGYEQSLKAQLFTERGLYRPGEKVHIGAIIKRVDWQSLAELPLKLNVIDPRGQIIQTRSLLIPKSGLIESSFVSDASHPTGTYQLSLSLSERRKGMREIGRARFRLEEFQADTLRIQTRFAEQATHLWLQPENVQLAVQLDTLYGSPALNHTVNASLSLSSRSLSVPDYPNYHFSIPAPTTVSAQDALTPTLESKTTDASGSAVFSFTLPDLEQGFYELAANTEGFELAGGRSVKSRNVVTISSNTQVLGIKPDGDLSFLHKDSRRSVALLALDSTGREVPVDTYSVQIDEQRYVSSLVENDDGSFSYQSVKKYERNDGFALSKSNHSNRLDLNTTKPGTYRARFLDGSGVTQAEFFYTVVGDENLTANLERDAELTLSLDAAEYKPGGTVSINISAPYTGSGLITIERERVLAYHWFKASQTNSVQQIKLPDDIEGNAYVNVTLVRDIDSEEVFINPLSYAVSPIRISPGVRRLAIELDSPRSVRPGQNLPVTASTSRPAKAIVYAVDAGILQAANYKQPKPLPFFLPKMALQVDTYQLADLILPRHASLTRRAAPGGGEGRALLGQNLNPFRRKAQAPVVFWSGIIELDHTDLTIDIPVPDYFNGELQLFVLAVDEDGVGAQSSRSVSKAPIVIQPNVLPAVSPGDEFYASAMVANELGHDATIKVTLKLPDKILSNSSLVRTVQMAAGAQENIEFSIQAGEDLGPTGLTFVAKSDDIEQSRTTTLSIRPAVNFSQTLTSGVSEKPTITVELPRQLRPHYATQTLLASASPLILGEGLRHYLADFPHACTEQMVSKLFPQVGLLQAGLLPEDRDDLARQVTESVAKLRARQRSDGGFAFWPGMNASHEWASVYLLHFLTEARELGISVPSIVLEQGTGYLRALAANRDREDVDALTRAYAIYVLTRQEFISTNYLTDLHETLKQDKTSRWESTLTASYMAASYQLLKLDEMAEELIANFDASTRKKPRSDFDTSLSRHAQHLYLLSRHFPERLEALPEDWLDRLSIPVASSRFNTFSASFATLALAAYSKAVELSSSGLPRVSIDANPDAAFARADLPVGQSQSVISNQRAARVFYSLTQSGFDAEQPRTSIHNGLELSREFVNRNGESVNSVRIGEDLTVRIRFRSDGPLRTNLALVALLPGGFEIDRSSARKQENADIDYIDLREDRAVFYLNAGRNDSLIEFSIKAIAKGRFNNGQVHLGSMYDLSVAAYTAAGEISVTP